MNGLHAFFLAEGRKWRRHPFSALIRMLCRLAMAVTAFALLYLVGDILIKGVPNLKPELFSLHFTTENQSMLPAIISTLIIALVTLCLALGATAERIVVRAGVPAARSGILAAVVLAVGRAIGETMAVVMVAGNQPRLTSNLFKGIRTLTGNIVMEMGYATDLHREALIATGVVLFVFILMINLLFSALKRREAQ